MYESYNYCTLSWLSILVTRVYVYVLLFWSHSLLSHPLLCYVRIAFLCCVPFGCQHFYLFAINFFTIIYTMGFPSSTQTVTVLLMLCGGGVAVAVAIAIVTIVIVACLPFIHCRCCHFLFDFHRIYIHVVHWHSSSVTVLVHLLLLLLPLLHIDRTWFVLHPKQVMNNRFSDSRLAKKR